jgi:branched-chain amino acid transport system permease protein
MRLYLQAAVSGALTGGLYGMMSLGVSLSWGVLRIINLAHFSFILLAGYVTYALSTDLGWDPLVSIAACVPAFFVLGAVLQWLFQRLHVDELGSLLVTFGLFIILESLMRTTWTADFRRIPAEDNPYGSGAIWIGSIALRTHLLAAFVAALAVAAATTYLLRRTDFGRAVRALAEDPDVAAAFGVDRRAVAAVLSGLASSYSALAGVFLAMGRALFPGLAIELFGVVFAVVMLGGLGSTFGALAAGVIIGVVGALATVIGGPPWAPLATFGILLVTLVVRPQGLFARRARL